MAAVFVLPITTAGQQGPVAAMVSTAGWASAARRLLGKSWIVTPNGTIEPDGARRAGSEPMLTSHHVPPWRRHIPTLVKTAGKDLRQWRRANRFHIDPDGPWTGEEVRFVWQRHELFHTAGLDLAQALGIPSVLFVPATLVWEARQWGTKRPGWGRLIETSGERPSLKAADIVACGSVLVAEQAMRIGADPNRVLVTPTGVDLDLFGPSADREGTRRRLGLTDRFVVGWVGSFRPFHNLDQAIDAIAAIDGATLLLVGDGPERRDLERRAAQLGISVTITGTVHHSELPDHLAAMDAALVLSSTGETFHYSPLKLGEYLAAGLPVVAPAVAPVLRRLHHGVDSVLVPPGDTGAMIDALTELRDDDGLRKRLAKAARIAAEESFAWDHQVRQVLAALERTKGS